MVDKKRAFELWKLVIGDKEYGYDFAGKKIKKEDYLVNNQVGWVVSYVKPLELGGPSDDSNTVIMHIETLEERDNQYPNFTIVGKKYVAKYDEKEDFYYIEKEEYDGGFFI